MEVCIGTIQIIRSQVFDILGQFLQLGVFVGFAEGQGEVLVDLFKVVLAVSEFHYLHAKHLGFLDEHDALSFPVTLLSC